MRHRTNSSNAEVDPTLTGNKRGRREGRGWGPFTGGQLTVVIVAIAAMFALPTAALAATGAFTSSSNATPAVKGTNTGSAGTGVHGTGKKYGVYSNGPLGVANGKKLICTGCVGSKAIAAGSVSAAKLTPDIREYDPVSARVDFSGTFVSGHHAFGAVRSAVGEYAVTFDQDVSLCTLTVSPEYAGRIVNAFSGADDFPTPHPAVVYVVAVNPSNTKSDTPFDLVATC